MSTKNNSRTARKNGIYHQEHSTDRDAIKPISNWKLNIHVDPDDLDEAYDVLSPYAADKNLNIAFLESREFYDNGSSTIMIDHTNEMGDLNELASDIEYGLTEAGIRSGHKDDFKGRPVNGRSLYIDSSLESSLNREKEKLNPFKDITVNRQPVHQEGMDFEEEQEDEKNLL